MAQTTTALNACNNVIEIDDAGGTPQDVSGSTSKFDANFDKQLGEAYTFEGTDPIRLTCKRNATFNISAMYTRDGTEARALIESWYQTGGLRTVSLYPEGQVNGARFYQGEFHLKSFKFSGDASDANPMMMDCEIVPSGAITFDNYTT